MLTAIKKMEELANLPLKMTAMARGNKCMGEETKLKF